jgi:hypothetical protein
MYPMGYKSKLLKRAGNKYAPYFGSWRNTSAGVCETPANKKINIYSLPQWLSDSSIAKPFGFFTESLKRNNELLSECLFLILNYE